MLAQVTENGIGFGDIFDKFKVDIDSYTDVIKKFSELDFEDSIYKLDDGKANWDAISKAIKGCDEIALSYFKTLDDGKGTINNQSASVEGLNTYLEKNGNGFQFAAIKAALFNAALNAGIMLAATVAVKALVQELDNAADSLEDVESRIQDNQTALSNYASKVEELTKKLEELNQTDVEYLSEDERTELETETKYIESQIKLYNLLAESKQKAINDDYIKATTGSNEELYLKKVWEYATEEFDEHGLEALFHELPEELRLKPQDTIFSPFAVFFKKVDDGNYITEANELLDEYRKLQDKTSFLQNFAIEHGNNETLDNDIDETQSQIHQTANELSQYIEKIQTARDALYHSSNGDDYADVIAEMDREIENYQNVLTSNVYTNENLGTTDLQRDLIGIRDVLHTVSQDLGDLEIFDPIIEQINELIGLVGLCQSLSFDEVLNLDKLFLIDKLSEIQQKIKLLKDALTDQGFGDKLNASLSDSIPPELMEKWESFQNIMKGIREHIDGFIQDIDSKTGLSEIFGGLEEHLNIIYDILSGIAGKFGWIFKDAIEAWNSAHDLDYSGESKNPNTAGETENPSTNQQGENGIDLQPPLSISQTIDQLSARLKPSMDSLKSAWQNIFTSDGFAINSIDIIATCDSIKSRLDELNAAEDVTVDYAAFENFVRVLSDTESTEEDVENAFTSLADSIVRAGLSGTEDFDTLKAALEDLGVVNNEIIAFRALAENTEALKAAGLDLAAATYEDIAQFADERVAAENLTQAIQMLTQQKILNAFEEMDTSTDAANMVVLAQKAGMASDVIANLTELETIYQEVAKGTLNEYMLNKYMDRANELRGLIKDGVTRADYTPEIDSKPVVESASTHAKESAKDMADLLDKELAVLDKKMEAGYIDFDDYIKARLALIQDYYDKGTIAADQYYSHLEKHYDQELSYRDKVVKAVARRIDKEIKSLQKQKDKVKETYQVQIDALQKQKQLLEEANRERQREIDLQKALYELERARNQRTKLVYSEDNGMHYVADSKAIRDAEQEAEDARFQIQIGEIEQSITKLEEARDRENDAIDEMIDKLEAYKEQWNDITSAYEEEQEDLIAAQMLGKDWENDILAMRLDMLNQFKDEYIAIQQAMVDAAYQAAQAMADAEKATIGDSSVGTVGDNTDSQTILSNDKARRPLQPGDNTYDLMQKFDAYLPNLDGSLDALFPHSFYEHHRQINETANQLMNNSSIVNNNRNVQQPVVNHINVTCPGVTSQQVAEQLGSVLGKELDKQFSGFHNYTDQMSRTR